MALDKPEAQFTPYDHPAGGRGAVKSSLEAFQRQGITLKIINSFAKANKPGGFDCPGCAFPDKGDSSISPDSCEQGQKAIAWEMTRKKADAAFFAQHTLSTLRHWTDFELENQGRLTEPLSYNARTDRYEAISWHDALMLIAQQLQSQHPDRAAFYASGRSSNEAAFLWQLLARAYGCANLPDSSNLCHEPSGYALKEQIGIGKGTCSLQDFDQAELFIVIGQNPATNHPRMMGALHEAAKRGATIIALNPLAEHGFTNFSDPKDMGEMLLDKGLQVAKQVYQVKIGGDLAALKGVIKALIERHDAGETILDTDFIAQHTQGIEALLEDVRHTEWPTLISKSGLSQSQMQDIAQRYAQSNATMATWCMGITHHEDAVATVQMIINLLLLRGNIGKPGAGALPVRGHSNVQGDRTMGCTFKVPPQWLTNMEQAFPGIQLSHAVGQDAIGVIESLLNGQMDSLFTLGGNFGAASPDSVRLYEALSKTALTVHIATKFNRSHCYPGHKGLILPCLGRTDQDIRAGQEQTITVEDSMSIVHASRGIQLPLSDSMMSEPAIIAAIGHALIGSSAVDWLGMANNYSLIRDKIEVCQQQVFDGFEHYNQRIDQEGKFWLTNWAAQRRWKTASNKAEFKVHPVRLDGPIERAQAREGDRVLALMTLRSHDQFNTTVYGQDDRYRGVFGGRHVLFINQADRIRLGFQDHDYVDIRTCSEDGLLRQVNGFRLISYNIPVGCAAAYFPEATPLVPLGLHARHTRTPASKEIPIILLPAQIAKAGGDQTLPLAAPLA